MQDRSAIYISLGMQEEVISEEQQNEFKQRILDQIDHYLSMDENNKNQCIQDLCNLIINKTVLSADHFIFHLLENALACDNLAVVAKEAMLEVLNKLVSKTYPYRLNEYHVEQLLMYGYREKIKRQNNEIFSYEGLSLNGMSVNLLSAQQWMAFYEMLNISEAN